MNLIGIKIGVEIADKVLVGNLCALWFACGARGEDAVDQILWGDGTYRVCGWLLGNGLPISI